MGKISVIMDRQILYKYRSLDGINKERVERVFSQSELFFPTPLQFNDPFDCGINLSFEGTKEEWSSYVDRIVSKQATGMSPSDRLLLRKRLKRGGAIKGLSEKIIIDMMGQIGVFSLSETPVDLLMWSHYSDSHRGVCLGFYAGPHDKFFRVSQEVKYQSDYPTTRVYDDAMIRMEAMVLTKSSHWSYEREFRIIDHENGPGVKHFPPELLACVVLGSKIAESDRSDVLQWATAHPAKPRVLQAKKAERQFALELIDVA